MTKLMTATAAAMLCLAIGSCSKDDSPAKAKETAPAATGTSSVAATPDTRQHAPAGFVPGSHEDWCGEHQVPESQCTRCSPELVAAFKATGDWCEDDGLPESQCRKCNPDLEIVRPPPSAPAEPRE